MNRFMRLSEVKTVTGLSRSSIYQYIADGKFPAQVKLGARAVAWLASDIQGWMDNQIGLSRSDTAAA